MTTGILGRRERVNSLNYIRLENAHLSLLQQFRIVCCVAEIAVEKSVPSDGGTAIIDWRS
jgi:hypothetical protein